MQVIWLVGAIDAGVWVMSMIYYFGYVYRFESCALGYEILFHVCGGEWYLNLDTSIARLWLTIRCLCYDWLFVVLLSTQVIWLAVVIGVGVWSLILGVYIDLNPVLYDIKIIGNFFFLRDIFSLVKR